MNCRHSVGVRFLEAARQACCSQTCWESGKVHAVPFWLSRASHRPSAEIDAPTKFADSGVKLEPIWLPVLGSQSRVVPSKFVVAYSGEAGEAVTVPSGPPPVST